MFTVERGKGTNKGDNSKLIFARIMSLFGLGIFSEKAVTAKCWHLHLGALVFTIFFFFFYYREHM